MQQATATEYQTQHNIEWTKGNHTNTANTVDTGVLPQHHHAGEYYHRGTFNSTKSYKHEGYGHYNSGYHIYEKFEQDKYGSCGYKGYYDGYYDGSGYVNYGNEDYRDECSDDYQYGGGYYDTYSHGYDDYNYGDESGCVYECIHSEYGGWKDVKENINEEDDETVITNNKRHGHFNTGNKERMETESNFQNLGSNRYAVFSDYDDDDCNTKVAHQRKIRPLGTYISDQ